MVPSRESVAERKLSRADFGSVISTSVDGAGVEPLRAFEEEEDSLAAGAVSVARSLDVESGMSLEGSEVIFGLSLGLELTRSTFSAEAAIYSL